MSTSIPSAAEVRARLQSMKRSRMIELARSAGVPWTTLVKIRNGQTANPGVETVRAIWPELACVDAPPAERAAPAKAA